VTRESAAYSYRALFELPSVTPLLLGMQIARVGQAMVSVLLVLFALDSYRSPQLAGLAGFFGIFPGLLVSPVAGALLDRHGRTRLVTLDYVVALLSLSLMGVLAYARVLPPWLLLLIAAVASLTAPLSATGLRSLFPLIIPVHLWERANAVDSIGYVSATIIGPPLAAWFVTMWGGPAAFIMVGLSFGLAAAFIRYAPDPARTSADSKPLLTEAWQGLLYTWRNPTLRGLGFCISVANLVNGAFTIVVPLLVLDRFHLQKTAVGLIFAVQGVTAMFSAVFFGRVDTRNRERTMLAVPMIATGAAAALLLVWSRIETLILMMAITGFLNGPLDVALFTVRQRRTDPNWTGRAFAVSMSFNYLGVPAGAAIAGALGTHSIEAAIVFGCITSVLAGFIAVLAVPSSDG
jgi:predicted MFS family arabinose efflux permease